MHPKARPRVHLADRPARFAVRHGDIVSQEIDAADVEADGFDRPLGHFPVVGMHDIGDIECRAAGGQICRRAQVNFFLCSRHAVPVVADLCKQALSLVIELEPGQHFLMADTTPRVLIDDIDKLLDRMHTVTKHMTGFTFGGRDELAVDHEQSMIEARDKAFDDNRAAVLASLGERRLDLRRCLEIDRDATTVIAGKRLDDDREADQLRRTSRILRTADDSLLGYRKAEIAKYAVRLLFVAGKLDRDIAGRPGRCRLDSLLETAVTELHEAIAVEA